MDSADLHGVLAAHDHSRGRHGSHADPHGSLRRDMTAER